MKNLRDKVNFGYIYLAMIPLFAVIYTLLPDGYIYYSQLNDDFWANLYLSAVTITTLGFGDITPLNDTAALIVGAESVLGVVTAGLFLNQVAHSRSQYDRKAELKKKAIKNRLRESDKLLQYADIISAIEDRDELEEAVKDFVLTIDLHDYRELEEICTRFIIEEDEKAFMEAFNKEIKDIRKLYDKLKEQAGDEYWA